MNRLLHGGTERPFLRSPKRLVFAAASLLWAGLPAWGMLGAWSNATMAQEPLYEQVPFDRITLNENFDRETHEVLPIDFPEGRPPEELPKSGFLTVFPVDRPAEEFRISWSTIETIQTFHELVLQEARQWIDRKEFQKAYNSLEYLFQAEPDFPGLQETYENFLLREGEDFLQQQKLDNALARAVRLNEENHDHPQLSEFWGKVIDALVRESVQGDRFSQARGYLQFLKSAFPAHPVLKTWNDRFREQAENWKQKAEAAFEDASYSQAHEAVRMAMRLWPTLPGLRALFEKIHLAYPRVVIGVTLPAPDYPDPLAFGHWAHRRTSRLVYRTLTEYVRPGVEGGEYHCPLGTSAEEQQGRFLSFRLHENLPASPDSLERLTGLDVADCLYAYADLPPREVCVPWRESLVSLQVERVLDVHLRFRARHVRPESLLVAPVGKRGAFKLPEDAPDRPYPIFAPNGPFLFPEARNASRFFRENSSYFLGGEDGPRELVERRFDRSDAALNALKRGEIEVLDRLAPWQVDSWNDRNDLRLGKYTLPSIHFLVPNYRKPAPANRTFRRALLYGLRREWILSRLLRTDDVDRSRGVVLSAPFPMGESMGDALGYAYNTTIDPRSYRPKLAMALAELGLIAVAQQEEESPDGQDEAPEEAKQNDAVLLAHPPHDGAAIACNMIKRQWEALGLTVKLLPYSSSDPIGRSDTIDFWYVECRMREPMVDAARIFSPPGLTGHATPHMLLALRKLKEASDWREVSQCLRDIHQIAFDETTVLPLWQLTDHYAYRKGIGGIAPSTVTLYQDIEQWKVPFHWPHQN
jgi:tetratricopeptide (TPR) repeat protein